MPVVNDDFNQTCTRLDLNPEWSMVIAAHPVKLALDEQALRRFNECVALVAPGTPPLGAEQVMGAARRLARAVGAGNEAPFIRMRLRRAAEIRALLRGAAWTAAPALLAPMQDLLACLDGPVALVPLDVPVIGGLDRALLIDLAMPPLRAELDEYADFCRYRAGEAGRLGIPVAAVDTERDRWSRERSEELRLERLVRRARGAAYGKPVAGASVFRVS